MKRDLESLEDPELDTKGPAHVVDASPRIEQDNHSDKDEEEDEDDEVGPILPSAIEPSAPLRKRRKVVLNAKKFQQNLPQLDRYARSFMHRDTLSSVSVTTQTNFVVTASADGFVKFWKKQPSGIEFVKQYHAHVGPVTATSVSVDDTLYASASASEKSIKAFDVVNFDLFTMLQLEYEPRAICWVSRRGHSEALLAVSDADSPTIYIYDMRGDNVPLYKLPDIHAKSVNIMTYNSRHHCVISCDEQGNIEYWSPDSEHTRPEGVFSMKSSTDLYEFRKSKSVPTCITVSPDGNTFATFSYPDREVRLFRFATGKIARKYDESLATIEEMHRAGTAMVALDDIEFGKRLGIERELERTPAAFNTTNVLFDESGLFLLYPTMLGVKVVNTHSNVCVKVYGRDEKLRILHLSLYQGAPKRVKSTTLAMAASDNPLLTESSLRDPVLFTTAYKTNRFYLFTSHELNESKTDRDAINEKPTAEESAALRGPEKTVESGTSASLHTSAGDVHLTLYPTKAPKAVENFVTLAKRGYYDGTIFHRTIKQFMIQGGDPEGTGTGGVSIWGHEFADEISDLGHDKYTLSMANAGPNTNGSQFFITTAETHHLDGKHTVFGRVQAGFEVVHRIESAPVGKLDRPRAPVHIHSIEVFK
ncbi:putative Peptidyl-prolyl cis-trans isomerase [Taphrina deformans PYCC 5710]|uniref:peptidylprolyl isomerase n=1 Tax=Taphrina deformans (strain PYCC 5710 / ATCC 11124 / CBS 356.35 / IMI 108563 / JCM 9778 / NBRC 8474) TaxID=1097556 RepID=R4X6M2_TAPDE|nr:putative Peptidyl-prolyl cis-trans isomerase [Taphrina deformans PYCC 5710]|eukprot:CCG80831.1 putative Peptidyl-prolyl cis-trans isomerase [Taphrina deformans PYCC 5710]